MLMVANWDWVLYNFRLPLVRALEREGLDVILVSPPGQYVQDIEDRGFKWYPWPMRRSNVFPGGEIYSLWKLFNIYQKLQPIAVHHITIKPIFYGSIAAKLSGVSPVINNFTGLGYLFSDEDRARRLRTFLLPVMRWALNHPQFHSVLLNESDYGRLNSLGIISNQRSTIISSDGVDVDQFKPPPEKKPSETPVVIMAGRLLRDKGIIEFLEAANLLLTQGVRAEFWIAGEPDPGNPTSISEDVLEKYSVHEGIKFLGHRDDMADLLRKANIAVLPSYYEGVPMFLLEAAATGLPLIGSNIEGCRLVIEDGENGFLVPKKDIERLADKIKIMLNNPELRVKMGAASRSMVEKKFDKEKIVDEFLQLYKRIGVISSLENEA